MESVDKKKIDKSFLKGKPIIWIMGGPGCGRSTQCEMIKLKSGYTHISSGDLLRHDVIDSIESCPSNSMHGSQLCQLMFEGVAVPNNIINDLFAEAMVDAAKNSE